MTILKFLQGKWNTLNWMKNYFYCSFELTKFDKFILVVFGIIVPTGDNSSDIFTSYNFFAGTYTSAGTTYYGAHPVTGKYGYHSIKPEPQTTYGLMTLLPILISFILTAIHWYQTEKKSKTLLLTLPLLLLQIWPQYRAGRILWLYMKSNRKWRKEKEHMDMQLASLGEFVLSPKITVISFMTNSVCKWICFNRPLKHYFHVMHLSNIPYDQLSIFE